MMPALVGIFNFIYSCSVIAICIYVLVLVSRFVVSHQRIASALERIAQNKSGDNR
jgi:hypothetical protein